MKELICSTCRAPLSPVPGSSQCRCEYCGSMNVISFEEKKTEDIRSTENKATGSAESMNAGSTGNKNSGSAESMNSGLAGNMNAGSAGNKNSGSAESMNSGSAGNIDSGLAGNMNSGLAGNMNSTQNLVPTGRADEASLAEKASKSRKRSGSVKGSMGLGSSLLRMYMVILIVAMLLISFALNSASVMADEGNDLRTVPQAASKLEGKEWMDVVQYFRDCGFEEIETCAEHDLRWDIFHKEGKVDEISISGCTNFDADATFYKDAKVIINYHSLM